MSEPPITCAECGKDLPPGEAVVFGGASVCAACRPVVVQRLQAGQMPVLAGVWRRGPRVVMALDANPGDGCIKCGERSECRPVRAAAGGTAAKFVTIIVALQIAGEVLSRYKVRNAVTWVYCGLAVVCCLWAAFAGLRGRSVRLPVCPLHLRPRPGPRRWVWICASACVASLSLLFLSRQFIPIPAILFTCALFFDRASRLVVWGVTPVGATHLSFLGAGEPFLCKLPEWPKS